MTDLPEVASLTEAAEYLRIDNPDTLRRMAARGDIGHIRQGRTYVFPAAVITAYIDAHTVKPTTNEWGLTTASAQRVQRRTRKTN